VAGPYCWVGVVIVLCVFSSLLLFLCFTGLQVGYSVRVSCSSQFSKIILIHYHRLLTAVLVLACKFIGFWMLLTVFEVTVVRLPKNFAFNIFCYSGLALDQI